MSQNLELEKISTEDLLCEMHNRGVGFINDEYWGVRDIAIRRNISCQKANQLINEFFDEIDKENGFYREGIRNKEYTDLNLRIKVSQKMKYVNIKAFNHFLANYNFLSKKNFRKHVPKFDFRGVKVWKQKKG